MGVPDISLKADSKGSEKINNNDPEAGNTRSGNGEVSMSVSPICMKNGKKVAYVMFSDGNRSAEGEIPGCKIKSSIGYSDAEIGALEDYMMRELSNLKKMAAGINLLDAIMGKN